jgi:hypothetical protein
VCFGVFGCFLVQFLGGLLAVREPAGCAHACSKWQTSVPPLPPEVPLKGGEREEGLFRVGGVMNFAPTPLPQRERGQRRGGRSKQESSARRRKHKSVRRRRINTKTGGDARWQRYDALSTGRSRTPNRCSGVPSAKRGTAKTIPPSAFGTTNAAAPKSTKSPKGRDRLPSPLQARRYSDAKRESSDEGL